MKETMEFQTESKELLNLMINSIYSNKEIFLRELLSNASDAIDKYRYASLTSEGKLPLREGEIRIEPDEKNRTIVIKDNGIGMSKEDLISSLGTIAHSGTKDFMSKIKDAKNAEDIDAIGQFGVGFYSAYMVADRIEVTTTDLEGKSYRFESEGKESYTIEEIEGREEKGTEVKLFLKPNHEDEDYDRYTKSWTIEDLVKKYSDYVRYPIKMMVKTTKTAGDDEHTDKTQEVLEDKTLNSMVPLWKRTKAEVTDEKLNEFYKSKYYDSEDPLISLFLNIDGLVSYNALVFIPSHAPYNLYSENYEKGLQLYCKNVFIKDKCKELVPDYLKFIKGLVNSDDFDLNVSREILQNSPAMRKIADSIEKKVIDKLKDTKEKDYEKYVKFFEVYGDHLKYGVYDMFGMKKDLIKDLLIFHSLNSKDEEYVSLKQYVEKMAKDQKVIYYASGDSIAAMRNLPQIEKFKASGKDVLLLDKKIDEFALISMRDYDGKEFKNIATEAVDELSKEEKAKLDDVTANNKRFLDDVKEALAGQVDDVAFSSKLVDSPVCISTKEGISLGMEKALSEDPNYKDNGSPKAAKILEINPEHDLFKALAALGDDDESIKNYAPLLYEEAMLLEGYDIKDKPGFVKKLNELMLKSLRK